MIDYASIAPLMSLSTFVIGFIAILIIVTAVGEMYENREERKRRR